MMMKEKDRVRNNNARPANRKGRTVRAIAAALAIEGLALGGLASVGVSSCGESFDANGGGNAGSTNTGGSTSTGGNGGNGAVGGTTTTTGGSGGVAGAGGSGGVAGSGGAGGGIACQGVTEESLIGVSVTHGTYVVVGGYRFTNKGETTQGQDLGIAVDIVCEGDLNNAIATDLFCKEGGPPSVLAVPVDSKTISVTDTGHNETFAVMTILVENL